MNEVHGRDSTATLLDASNPMAASDADGGEPGIEGEVRAHTADDVSRVDMIHASLAEHRLHYAVAPLPPADGLASKKKCCKKKQKKDKKKKKKKKPPKTAVHALGFLRKGLVGCTFLLHPLVANSAFKAVNCVMRGDQWVVAAAPKVLCAGPNHLHVYIVALIAIAVSIIGFPLYSMWSLSRSAGWCGKLSVKRTTTDAEDEAKKEQPLRELDDVLGNAAAGGSAALGGREAGAEDEDGGPRGDSDVRTLVFAHEQDQSILPHLEESHRADLGAFDDDKAGPISVGLCCCCGFYYEMCIRNTRKQFRDVHSKELYPGRYNAWTSFTDSDYKPEYFWFRIVFNLSITLLAMANTFLSA